MNPLQRYRDTAVEAIRRGMLLSRQIQNEFSQQDALTKYDRSPVTIADFAVQALVARLLTSQFPQIPVVAEEDATFLRNPDHFSLLERVFRFLQPFFPDLQMADISEWIDQGTSAPGELFWTLDPIDGTKGFLRGDHFAIALALIHKRTVELGVIGCPRLTECREETADEGFLFAATRGHGAQMQPVFGGRTQPIAVSPCQDLSKLLIVESYESSHSDFSLRELLQKELAGKTPPRQIDGQVKYSILASGGADLYLRIPPPRQVSYREKIWDHAAGMCIVEEAGGRVSDIFGRSLDFSRGRSLAANCGILASNGIIHDQILTVLEQILPFGMESGENDTSSTTQARSSDFLKIVRS